MSLRRESETAHGSLISCKQRGSTPRTRPQYLLADTVDPGSGLRQRDRGRSRVNPPRCREVRGNGQEVRARISDAYRREAAGCSVCRNAPGISGIVGQQILPNWAQNHRDARSDAALRVGRSQEHPTRNPKTEQSQESGASRWQSRAGRGSILPPFRICL